MDRPRTALVASQLKRGPVKIIPRQTWMRTRAGNQNQRVNRVVHGRHPVFRPMMRNPTRHHQTHGLGGGSSRLGKRVDIAVKNLRIRLQCFGRCPPRDYVHQIIGKKRRQPGQ